LGACCGHQAATFSCRCRQCRARSNRCPWHVPAARAPSLQLLGYIKKDRQGDALVEKLCQRFGASDDPLQWHSIAFCLTQVRWGEGGGGCVGAPRFLSHPLLSLGTPGDKPPGSADADLLAANAAAPLPCLQLPISEKGLKKLNESFRFYKHALGDEEASQPRRRPPVAAPLFLPCTTARCTGLSLIGRARRSACTLWVSLAPRRSLPPSPASSRRPRRAATSRSSRCGGVPGAGLGVHRFCACCTQGLWGRLLCGCAQLILLSCQGR
jgi:hypothetical protein